MSIEQIGPRRWRIRVQFRDPRTGSKRTLRATFEGTEKGALRREEELRAEARAAGERKQRPRLRAFASSWLAGRRGTLKPSVATRYAIALDLHILPALGDLYVDAIIPSDVQSYVTGRLDQGAAGYTVLNELRLLRTIAKDSVAAGVAERNWADRVKPPPVRQWTEDDPNLLSADELAKLLEHVPRPWLPLVTLMAFTGLRWGEVSGLRWEDLDAKAGLIRVRRANWRGRAVEPKTAKSRRSVPLPAPVVSLLGPRRASGWLFPTAEGELHRGTPLRSVLQRACKAADVRVITPHGLRRTFNDLARRVASAQVVKAITGHTTDAMLAHYSQVDHGEKALATRRVLELAGIKLDDEGGDA